jgi:hypothetical protein
MERGLPFPSSVFAATSIIFLGRAQKVNLKWISILAAGVLSATPAFANSVTIDFEGVGSFSSVDGYYNGGTDSSGGSGTNVGIYFGLDALGLSNDAAGTYFSNAPSPGTVMAPVGLDAALSSLPGFTQASLYYSSNADTYVSVFSGLNGTGDLLGTTSLLANAMNDCSDSPFCSWGLATLDFTGIAHSIQFGSAANAAGFDNVNISVPEPSTAWLWMTAIVGFGVFARRKRSA